MDVNKSTHRGSVEPMADDMTTAVSARPERAAPRIAINRDVRVRYDGRTWRSRTRNLSAAGLFVDTREMVPPGAQLDLDLELDSASPPLTVCGTVVRLASNSEPPGLGIQFLPHGQENARTALGSFVQLLMDRATAPRSPRPLPRQSSGPSAKVIDLEQWQPKAQSMLAVNPELREDIAKLSAARRRLTERTQQMEEKAARLTRFQELLERQSTDLDQKQVALADQEHKLRSYRRALSERYHQLKAREARLKEFRFELEETRRQLQVHAFERKTLAGQVKQLRAERDALQSRLEAMTDDDFEAPTKKIVKSPDRRESDSVPGAAEWSTQKKKRRLRPWDLVTQPFKRP